MRVTNKQAGEQIALRVNFQGNSMSGRWEDRYSSSGMLRGHSREQFHESHDRCHDGDGLYIVYSYATPIAWWDTELCRWFVVEDRFSVTTSRHQSIVRMAIDSWDGEKWANDYEKVSA